MRTNPPSHEAIAQRAQEIWSARGKPEGQDTAIWLEAERQLTLEWSEALSSDSGEAHQSLDPFGQQRPIVKLKNDVSKSTPPDPLETAAKFSLRRHAASAPQLPTHKNARKEAPPESGKPLWNQPHSS